MAENAKTKISAVMRRCRKRLIYIGALSLFVFLFRFLRHNRALMNFMTDYVAHPARRVLAAACSVARRSVAEWVVIFAALAAAGLIVLTVVRMIRFRRILFPLFRFFTAALAAALTVSVLMTLLWNVNYYADTFQQKSGLRAREGTVAELARVAGIFAGKLSRESGNVARDADGVFSEDISGLFDLSAKALNPLTGEFPFLGGPDLKAKEVLFSRAMSYLNTTGIAFPFTGEAIVNTDQPRAFIPVTIAHEIAHQRKVASEQEANFVAILACDRSPHASYRYSGYLLAYNYLASALSGADYDRYLEIASSLSPGVLADLEYNYAYWRQFDGKLSEISDGLYDGYLKDQGQDMGTKSYGAVVDMLIAYYLPAG